MYELIKAANIIKQGGVVAFPTETVYGLGADATNEQAVQKIFQIKNRPQINPLIVHVTNIAQAESIAHFNEDAYTLSQFWPGPLTIIVSLKPGHRIANSVLAGLSTIAIRVPAHDLARQLIDLTNCPIAAPSANPSGYISATNAGHVATDFADTEVFVINDNNPLAILGLESTIIDTTTATPTILRYGFITPETIELALGKKIINLLPPQHVIKAPGMLDKHYAPKTKLRLNADNMTANEIGLNFGNSNLDGSYTINLSKTGNMTEAAANLYNFLRILDNYSLNNSITQIAVATIPNHGIGLAINDRLKRAAFC
ncbi:Threonylcarbamoyl-AMP synthase [Candidatus Trichorickettsia mobilis]|jgi:L-threonylcarbamoyladenylate synthase|uniref:Threonylcarbamoyl-AMP synthase n=1 Tax=Candidatus Trichorickettsia mobilis TaxID=1346319 RepID=A0ABZ0UTE2_9RICK|nr:L-threonylcarbamoyladenylate synthase [Candidatus Trichorickettsia mobilis]WPY01310.1 Threonylcarbamoyl-AMP synthase [Candidatus Trichorickettsia mobilis]